MLCRLAPHAALRTSARCHTRGVAYNVVISGGGLVGASFALALATNALTRHLRVALLEPIPPQTFAPLPPSPGLRTVALNRASVNFLDKIGVWKIMERKRVAKYTSMHVWDSTGLGQIRFDTHDVADIGVDALGHIVENDLLVSSLHEALAGHVNANAHVIPATLTEVGNEEAPNGTLRVTNAQDVPVVARLSNGSDLRAQLVVGADGGRSAVRNAFNLGLSGNRALGQAVVATVVLEDCELGNDSQTNYTAWQRFLPTGPIAMLPMAGAYANIVWSTTPSHAAQLLAMRPDALADAINSAFTQQYEQWPLSGGRPLPTPPRVTGVALKPASFPLRTALVSEYVRPRVALMGDAAHIVHPLAGHGVNLGMADAAALAGLLADAVQTGQDIGSMRLLREYEDLQKPRNAIAAEVIDMLRLCFSHSSLPFTAVRALGMAVAGMPFVKEKLIKISLGEL